MSAAALLVSRIDRTTAFLEAFREGATVEEILIQCVSGEQPNPISQLRSYQINYCKWTGGRDHHRQQEIVAYDAVDALVQFHLWERGNWRTEGSAEPRIVSMEARQ